MGRMIQEIEKIYIPNRKTNGLYLPDTLDLIYYSESDKYCLWYYELMETANDGRHFSCTGMGILVDKTVYLVDFDNADAWIGQQDNNGTNYKKIETPDYKVLEESILFKKSDLNEEEVKYELLILISLITNTNSDVTNREQAIKKINALRKKYGIY